MATVPNPPGGLRSQFAGDPEMLDLIRVFLDELPARVSSIRASLDAGRASDLMRLAHQLKGAAGGYGYPTIGDAAGRVEEDLKRVSSVGGELEGIRGAIDELLMLCQSAIAHRS